MKFLLFILLLTSCAHIDLNACTASPLVNDRKRDACIEFDDEKMCAWHDEFEGVYYYRPSCFADWVELP